MLGIPSASNRDPQSEDLGHPAVISRSLGRHQFATIIEKKRLPEANWITPYRNRTYVYYAIPAYGTPVWVVTGLFRHHEG